MVRQHLEILDSDAGGGNHIIFMGIGTEKVCCIEFSINHSKVASLPYRMIQPWIYIREVHTHNP